MLRIENGFNNSKRNRLKIIVFTCSVAIFMVLFSLLFKNSKNVYIFLNQVLCASVAFSIGLICFSNKDLKLGVFYKNIAIGFFLISIISFFYIFSIRQNILTSTSFYLDNNFVKSNYYLEYLVILNAYMLKKIDKKVKYEMMIAIMIPFGILLFIGIIYVAQNSCCFDIMSKIILAIILILDLLIIYFNKINLKKNEKGLLYKYIIFISIYQYIINYSVLGNFGVVISLSFKFISYYCVFLIISEFVMKKSYESMKNELINVQHMQKELNIILKNRNKTLVELEHSIEKSSEKYKNLIEHISDGIVIFNLNKIYYINSEAEREFKIDNKNRLDFDAFIQMMLNGNKSIERCEYVNKNLNSIKNLDKDTFKFNLCSYLGIQYEVYFFNIDDLTRLVYIKDVTEKNRNYEIMRKYEEYLKGEKLKNEFYSNISHELRTPINLIYLSLQLNDVNFKNDKIQNMSKQNKTIQHNCLRLIRTISNFIDANKISQGSLKPNLKVYNIVSIVKNISTACNRYIKKIDNKLVFDAEEEELFVECDKEMIEKIILNILSNSVKFGKEGGTITVNVTADKDIITIRIRNNGYIVKEEEKPYIFDKFTKVNKSLNRNNEGSGLGLYLSKALVELNKGTIELGATNNNIGTEFIIKLPRCYGEGEMEESHDIIEQLYEKVDIEFSDIYI